MLNVYLKYHIEKAIMTIITKTATTTPPITPPLVPALLAAALPGGACFAGVVTVSSSVVGTATVLLCHGWVVEAWILGLTLINLPPSLWLMDAAKCNIIWLILSLDTTEGEPSAKILKTASSTWRFASTCSGSSTMTSSGLNVADGNARFLLLRPL